MSSSHIVWHTTSAEQAAERLGTDVRSGLDAEAIAESRARNGANVLAESAVTSPLRILWEQFTATLVLILLAAAGLSGYLGKALEAIAILVVVVLFGLLGFFQEYRAERAIAALKAMSTPLVRVRRERREVQIPAEEVVVGDVVLLEAGSVVPADLRLVESAGLRIQEAALTGESEPVDKGVERIDREDAPLGDRSNMAFMGTSVTYGRGAGVVVATGMRTELGKIARLIQQVEHEQTPLQRRLDRVGKLLAAGGVVVALIVAAIGLAGGETIDDVILTAISTMVAVVPEGLPAVVTLTLAIGSQRMLKRNALIRKLPAVETLGSVTVICSDKTGTLTENRMTVVCVDVAGHRITIEEEVEGGHISLEGPVAEPPSGAAMRLALLGGALVNDGSIEIRPEDGQAVTIGDPTETALLVAAARRGIDPVDVRERYPRVGEVPFDSDRKRMSTVHRTPAAGEPLLDAPYVAFVKGAVDGLIDRTSHVLVDGRVEPFDDTWIARVSAANDELAGSGMRVLAVAMRPLNEPIIGESVEDHLVLLAMVGLIDPPRLAAAEAVGRCLDAGIRPVMITGDHPRTALAIAGQLGIPTSRAVTGAEIERLDADELIATLDDVSVFARVSPEHKLRIVEAFSARDEVVAMTGDGVNDAPALKQANIGVAMGITGTDVSKEAADMVLRDDNFATIVAAVEEGRVIYDNLRRFLSFAIAGNVGKVLVMLAWPVPFLLTGAAPADPVALLPLQLLWLNLMTDGLLGLSLGTQPPDRDVMTRAPVDPRAGVFSGGLGLHTVVLGVWIGVIALGVGIWYFEVGDPAWQAMLFTTLAVLQLFQAFFVRSHHGSVLDSPLLGNTLMNVMVPLVLALQLAAIYAPGLSDRVLGLEPLSVGDWAVTLLAGVLFVVGAELIKLRWRSDAKMPARPGR